MISSATDRTFRARAALLAVGAGVLMGAAFAAWLANGSAMLVALAASGLAWCF